MKLTAEDRPFRVQVEGRTLTFVVRDDGVHKRPCVAGPSETIADRKALLRARKAAVEFARTVGLLEPADSEPATRTGT
jgi:hypothetical protein